MTLPPDPPDDTGRREPLFPAAVREHDSTTAIAVFAALEEASRPLTYDDLATELGVSRRTVKTAVYALRDADVVVSFPSPHAPNQKLHTLATDAPDDSPRDASPRPRVEFTRPPTSEGRGRSTPR